MYEATPARVIHPLPIHSLSWDDIKTDDPARADRAYREADAILASPVVPKTADEIKAVVMAWLDSDDPASWGDFEKRLNAAVSDEASPVVPVGVREAAQRLLDYADARKATFNRDDMRAVADAILAALGTKETNHD